MSKQIENPKKYCSFYKKFIVEELLFLENYLEYHYGNCAVIGRILKNENDYFLENIRITCIGRDCELPDGSVKIRLLTNLYKQNIPDRRTAEIHGKAVFYNLKSLNENQVPITLQDLYHQFNEFLNLYQPENDKFNLDNLIMIFNQSLLDKYEPAIQIRFINLCDEADELIKYNLKIRLLSE